MHFQPGEGPSRGLLRDCANRLCNRWIVLQHYSNSFICCSPATRLNFQWRISEKSRLVNIYWNLCILYCRKRHFDVVKFIEYMNSVVYIFNIKWRINRLSEYGLDITVGSMGEWEGGSKMGRCRVSENEYFRYNTIASDKQVVHMYVNARLRLAGGLIKQTTAAADWSVFYSFF